MIYQLLLVIGSIIITTFLVTSYIYSLKRLDKITIRQKVFIMLFILGYIGMVMDVVELVFFNNKINILFQISWYLHWISCYMFYFLLLYYIILYLKLENPVTFKDLFIDNTPFTFKNIFTCFNFIMYILIIVIVRPLKFTVEFEFIPFNYGIFVLISMAFYAIFMITVLVKYYKKNEPKRVNKILTVIIPIMAITASAILQIIIPTYAFLGLGIYLAIMFIYFLIENVDLIIAEELAVVKKNIEKSSNAKLDFLYNMSHDIRSPMNAIVELSKSLKDIEEFNETNIRNDIKSIKFSCNNLVDIVNNILDVNKIASGNESVQLKEYNLNKLLADLPYVIETRIGSKPIKLEFDIDQSIASKLIGDTTKIYRVIMNILTNSVKYTEVGKIRMIIKGNIDGDTQNLSIKISDTGYGIKKEDFDKMFTKFNRLDDATDNSIEGTGLGLVITKKYVDSMGGKIWFESEYGAGTIFYVELPQKIVDKTPLSEAIEGNDNKKIEVCDCKNSRVLIVDDNTLNIKITKKILEKYNIEVDSVKSGEECIYKIKTGENYDMILLDDVLPDLPGMEVAHVVKNIQGFKIPPIIAYTANVMNGIKEEYLKNGFDDYMPKPFDIHQFDSIIKRYCYKNKSE